MKTIVYVPGFTNPANTKQSKKFLEIQKAYPNDTVIQFSWSADDTNIRLDFEKFLRMTLNTNENFLFIGSSTGCNILLDVIQYCEREYLPRPHIVLLNPLFRLEQLKQELPGFDVNLRKQIKEIRLNSLEDNLIIFSKNDEILNHDLISTDLYNCLYLKNSIKWFNSNHSFSNLEFTKFLKPEIDAYTRGL